MLAHLPVIATVWRLLTGSAIKTPVTLRRLFSHTDMFGLRTTVLICLVTFIVSPVTALPFDAKPNEDNATCGTFKTLPGAIDEGPQELCGGGPVML